MAGRDRAGGYDWPAGPSLETTNALESPSPPLERTPLARTATSCTPGQADARFFVAAAVQIEEEEGLEIEVLEGATCISPCFS